MPLVLSLALRAGLVPVLPLVLIAWPAHGESTYITSHEEIPVDCGANAITTDLADLLASRMLPLFLQWCQN